MFQGQCFTAPMFRLCASWRVIISSAVSIHPLLRFRKINDGTGPWPWAEYFLGSTCEQTVLLSMARAESIGIMPIGAPEVLKFGPLFYRNTCNKIKMSTAYMYAFGGHTIFIGPLGVVSL